MRKYRITRFKYKQMVPSKRILAFQKLVEKKYNVYNGVFLNLPFESIANTGMYLPLLYQSCVDGLEAGKSPLEIIDAFFESKTPFQKVEDKVSFLFRVIQYVERQVVLFDSIEDASYKQMMSYGQNMSVKDFFRVMKDPQDRVKLKEKLSNFSVRLVFTAHPTQFYPLAVLDIINRLRYLISKNKLDEVDQTLQQLGLTSFIKKKKPTPFEEAQNIIYYLRYVYYDAIGEFYSTLKNSTIQDNSFSNPDLFKVGFWPGGDRDGNPFVTAKTTKKVADELRMNLLKCYYKDIKDLETKLTFSKVSPHILKLKKRLYQGMFDASTPIELDDILNPLMEARALLISDYSKLYLPELSRLIDKVNIFKTHFGSLDIRQDHRIHKQVVTAILEQNSLIKSSLDELTEADLIDILLNKKLKVHAEDFEEALIKDTIQNIAQLKSIQQKNGEEGCNRYIISNSEDIFSVLFVHALFRWSGWKRKEISFDIIPLFETMIGMENSESVMHALFSNPIYKEHIERRKNKQTIMLGFSDGTKDGGYLRANWEIFKTKETLTSVCNQYDVKAIFFDGRGGPPARGGGKTHRFYASQGKSIANNEIQLTIQGQTITSTFGTEDQFLYNTEQMLTAGLSNDFLNKSDHIISDKHRALMDELAQISFDKYDSLKKHPKFISYLENKSTLKYYSSANIGSRPGKRGNTKELTLGDLRAISFVGAWSQLKQNVPGYFGIGTAIKQLKEAGRINEIKDLFLHEPYFKALANNSMMSLSKCYFPLTAYMKEDKEYEAFWNILHDEYQLAQELLLEIADYKVLMQEEPLSKRSIKIREKIVLPLLTIQQYALQKIGAEDEHIDAYKKMVTRSLYGNINASRNSA